MSAQCRFKRVVCQCAYRAACSAPLCWNQRVTHVAAAPERISLFGLASDMEVTERQDGTMVGLEEGAPAPCELWEGATTMSLGHG